MTDLFSAGGGRFRAARVGLLLLLGLGACPAPSRDNLSSPDFATGDLAQPDMTDLTAAFDVTPDTLQTIQPPTTVMFSATSIASSGGSSSGAPINVKWSVDRADLAHVMAGPASSTTFTPTGTAGGLVTVFASLGTQTVSRKVLIQLQASSQNGITSNALEQVQVPADVSSLKAGGGVGGVGGEGLGVAVSDTATLAALAAPTGDGHAQNLTFLYPYDKTIWPRGLLAPLLMWSWSTNDADAIKIDLSTTSGSFSWSGTFGRPAILTQTSGPFIHHPIPQDVWATATNSAGGLTPTGDPDALTVSLTIAKSGVAYGPIKETWRIAPAKLTGTMYYQAYATHLLLNRSIADQAGNRYGAGILSIRSGDAGPKVAVGQNSTDDSGCRACHVVASHGRWLIAQDGATSYEKSYVYDLQAANVQSTETHISPDGAFGWTALLGDASYALTNVADGAPGASMIENGQAGTATSSFWKFSLTPFAAASTGLPATLKAAYPVFSPDDHYVAYVDVTASNNVSGPLTIATYDATSQAFGLPTALHSPMTGTRIGFPTILPDNSGILFETEIRPNHSSASSEYVLSTDGGARGELWWTTTGSNPQAVPLAGLNGKLPNGTSYLPIGGKNHGITGTIDNEDSGYTEDGYDDTTLSYEPTVLPIVVGGYAWVVFSSRRLYGNQLTASPWNSDPGFYNTNSLPDATVKKLWVAAIDLKAPAGSDPSYPPFYLPGQEILAANSRGFWVLDPCQKDGNSCETGDQCCGGCCQADSSGALSCETPPADGSCSSAGQCSGVQEKCTTAADCCDSSNACINNFCAILIQ